VKPVSPDSRWISSERCTCTVCPLLCDDILITADGVEQACGPGGEVIREALANDEPQGARPAEAWERDRPLDRGAAMRRAASMLSSARRVLVTGLADATLEAITAACDLAETLGATIDAGLPESARAAGPAIARAGEVTAVWEELRDRADLVIFWCCDPFESHPRFIERFVRPPLADGRQRRTIAIGPDSVMPAASTHRHLLLARDLAVEAARWLQMRIAGRHTTLTDTPLSATCVAVEEAIQSADCVAIITGDADDSVGLEAWSIVHLVRTIAHDKHAFQIPLGAGLAAGGANVAGASAACTWRYGAAGALARADRLGSLFLPGEFDARRLISRGEVDAVVVIGRLSSPLEQAIAERGDALSLVRISDAAEMPRKSAGHSIHIRCASGTIATTGMMLREDGRRVVLVPHQQATLPQMRELLVDLEQAVRQSPAVPAAGGQP
jgi:formylmethanofuran dehydrogenase subunit B